MQLTGALSEWTKSGLPRRSFNRCLFNHSSTIWLSRYKWTYRFLRLSIVSAYLIKLTNKIAPQSSKLGILTVLSDATFVLAIRKCDCISQFDAIDLRLPRYSVSCTNDSVIRDISALESIIALALITRRYPCDVWLLEFSYAPTSFW